MQGGTLLFEAVKHSRLACNPGSTLQNACSEVMQAQPLQQRVGRLRHVCRVGCTSDYVQIVVFGAVRQYVWSPACDTPVLCRPL
jgi:hypothetical protein